MTKTDELMGRVEVALEEANELRTALATGMDALEEYGQRITDRRTLVESAMFQLRSRARTFAALVRHATAMELTAEELLEVSDSIEDVVARLELSFTAIEGIANARG